MLKMIKNIFKKLRTNKEPLNAVTKKRVQNKNRIIERSTGNIHKFVIDTKYDVSFNSLKEEINDFYSRLGFNEIAYDREHAYLLKKRNDIEPYVSLRLKNDEYVIEIKNSQKIQLKILTN